MNKNQLDINYINLRTPTLVLYSTSQIFIFTFFFFLLNLIQENKSIKICVYPLGWYLLSPSFPVSMEEICRWVFVIIMMRRRLGTELLQLLQNKNFPLLARYSNRWKKTLLIIILNLESICILCINTEYIFAIEFSKNVTTIKLWERIVLCFILEIYQKLFTISGN